MISGRSIFVLLRAARLLTGKNIEDHSRAPACPWETFDPRKRDALGSIRCGFAASGCDGFLNATGSVEFLKTGGCAEFLNAWGSAEFLMTGDLRLGEAWGGSKGIYRPLMSHWRRPWRKAGLLFMPDPCR
jgi:hypothetical protein